MGLLDDAIREHLELKRRHGASEDEISRAEAEALTPARRPAPPVGDADGDGDGEHPVAAREDGDDDAPRLVVEPVDDVAPPPAATHAVHDIDEDPLAPPEPMERSTVDQATVETDALAHADEDDPSSSPGRLSE